VGYFEMLLPFWEGLIRTTPFDLEMAVLADRHYSRRKVGSKQFCYSGRKLVLRNTAGTVLFVWMFPDPALRMDKQSGYNCAIFRNESTRLSSEIILEAEKHAIDKWGPNYFYTYIDSRKIKSVNPGYCFKMAGWKYEHRTKSGLHFMAKR
jgi:hypothetical protein